MLKVQKLDPRATLPTVANPGEDLGYDLYALEDTELRHGTVTRVRTGIAVSAFRLVPELRESYSGVLGKFTTYVETPLGLIIEDRSSMADKGITKSGGVIDAGYRGEIKVLLTYWKADWILGQPLTHPFVYQIKAGDKIAQMRPEQVLTGPVEEVKELTESSRGDKGFGSSGV